MQRPSHGLWPDPGGLRVQLQPAAPQLGPVSDPGDQPAGGDFVQFDPNPAYSMGLRIARRILRRPFPPLQRLVDAAGGIVNPAGNPENHEMGYDPGDEVYFSGITGITVRGLVASATMVAEATKPGRKVKIPATDNVVVLTIWA